MINQYVRLALLTALDHATTYRMGRGDLPNIVLNPKESRKIWASFDIQLLPSTLTIPDTIFESIPIGNQIVDFGCGKGDSCRRLRALGHSHVVGIDINARAITYAAQSGPEVSYVIGDVTELPFQNHTLDFGIAQALLTTLATPVDRAAFLSEARRSIRPGGMIYVADFCQNWDSEYYRRRYIEGKDLTGEEGTFPVYDESTDRFLYYAHHFSEKELISLLTEAGFNPLPSRSTLATTRTGRRIKGINILAKV